MARFDKTESINIEDIVINRDNKEKKVEKEEKIERKIEEKDLKEETKELEKLPEIEDMKDDKDFSSLKGIVKNDFQEKTIVEMQKISSNKIGIASDHRGYGLKQKLTKYLNKLGYIVVDCGGDGIASDDYTEFGFKLGEAIKNSEVEKGIAICGSGIGISIACNKVKKVRCAKVNNVKEAKWARNDNDANVIALSARMPLFRAKDVLDVFLKTSFSGAERHQKRIDDLNNYR